MLSPSDVDTPLTLKKWKEENENERKKRKESRERRGDGRREEKGGRRIHSEIYIHT